MRPSIIYTYNTTVYHSVYWVNKNQLISVLPEIFQPQLGNTIKIMVDRKYPASHLLYYLKDKNSKIAKSE